MVKHIWKQDQSSSFESFMQKASEDSVYKAKAVDTYGG